MKNLIHYALAIAITVNIAQTKNAHAICSHDELLIAATTLLSATGTLISIGGVQEFRYLGSTDAVSLDSLSFSRGTLYGAGGVLAFFGLPLLLISLSPDSDGCRETHARRRGSNPVARETLEAVYLPSITTQGRPWPEMTIGQCRGLGFDESSCEYHIVRAWNEDRTVLQQMITTFFQRFNEELSQLEVMTPQQRRTLATQFATFVDEEILPYVSTHTVRVLHAMGRGLIARFHSEHVTADRRTLEIPLGASPVYVAPNGIGIHF